MISVSELGGHAGAIGCGAAAVAFAALAANSSRRRLLTAALALNFAAFAVYFVLLTPVSGWDEPWWLAQVRWGCTAGLLAAAFAESVRQYKALQLRAPRLSGRAVACWLPRSGWFTSALIAVLCAVGGASYDNEFILWRDPAIYWRANDGVSIYDGTIRISRNRAATATEPYHSSSWSIPLVMLFHSYSRSCILITSLSNGSAPVPTWTGWFFAISVWPIVGLLSIYPATLLVLRSRCALSATPNACLTCGYCLTGNCSGRCPECGAAVVNRT